MINYLINNIIYNKSVKIVAEIGVFQGETLCEYAPCIKERGGLIYAVDWFRGNIHEPRTGLPNNFHFYRTDPQEIEQVYQNFIFNLHKINCLDVVKILRGNSSEQGIHIPDHSLDICFIDGDHTYDGVIKDILAFENKIKPNGLFCGHDYNQGAVNAAVNRLLKVRPFQDYHDDKSMINWEKINE